MVTFADLDADVRDAADRYIDAILAGTTPAPSGGLLDSLLADASPAMVRILRDAIGDDAP